MILPISLIAVFSLVFISFLNWRSFIKAALFIVVIEGAIRKWVLPQASEFIYFLKDFAIIGAYIKFYFFSEHELKFPLKNNTINILVFLVSCWCLYQVFNPSLGSAIVGIMGLRGYILNIPLMWLLPTLFKSEAELYRYLRSYLLLTIPVGILGIVQFQSPPTSPINAYANQAAEHIATFGIGNTLARISGSFSYLDTYVVYLIVSFGLLIPLLFIKQSQWWRWTAIIAILLVTVNSFMTGSRGCVFAIILILIGYIGIKGLLQPASILRFVKQFLVPILIIIIAASIWFRPAINAFWLRVTSSDDASNRVSITLLQPLDFIQYKGLDGYGTGATQAASNAIRNVLGLPPGEVIPTGYEAEPGRIMLELGPFGFTLWYLLRLSILLALWRVFWKLKRPFLRELALIAFLIQTIQFNDQLVTHPVFSVYYWFLSGFIFLLPQLEKIENWHQQQMSQQYVYSSDFPSSSN